MSDNTYTPEQQAIIDKNWNGKPPEQCKGKCDMSHFIISACHACGWAEDMPNLGSDY